MQNNKIVLRSRTILRPSFLVYLLPIIFLISSCDTKMMSAGVTSYNHMSHFAIAMFTVNGAAGKNVNEGSGGGSENCCVSIPEKWRPGLKARIT